MGAAKLYAMDMVKKARLAKEVVKQLSSPFIIEPSVKLNCYADLIARDKARFIKKSKNERVIISLCKRQR